jgi:L-alanine-DL-glutamate epimerase-like enolase superfamily enzyme
MLSIDSVSAEPMSIELDEPFGIATGSQARADNVLVRVRLSDSTLGLGEAAPFPAVSGETQELALRTLCEHADAFVGKSIANWRPLCREADERMSGCVSAACALSCALLDAWLKSLGCPMWLFFGGTTSVLRTDITIPTGTVRAATEATRRAVSLGFRKLKVKVGGSTLSEDVGRLSAIAQQAPEVGLLLDANGAFSAEEALELLTQLGRVREQVLLFEQPTRSDDLAGSRRVMTEGRVAVAADESARTCTDVIAIAKQGAASAVNIKIMKSSLLEALDMITLSRRHGLKLMIGGMVESPLAMSVSACIAGGLGGFDWVDLDTPLFMRRALSLEDAPVSGGFQGDSSQLRLDVIEAGHGVHIPS